MIRGVGMVLILSGCFWMGNRRAVDLERRAAALEGLAAGLEQLRCELLLAAEPLPRLFGRLSRSAPRPCGALFETCGAALGGEEPFHRIWAEEVDGIPYLHPEDARLLAPLGTLLGRYPGVEQAKGLEQVCRALERQGELAREESRRLGRVYRAVGAAAGGFLLILLL